MARDYDAELAALAEKKKRIEMAKAAHEQRYFGPAGKDLVAMFPDVVEMNTKDRRAFINHLHELYVAEQNVDGTQEDA